MFNLLRESAEGLTYVQFKHACNKLKVSPQMMLRKFRKDSPWLDESLAGNAVFSELEGRFKIEPRILVLRY